MKNLTRQMYLVLPIFLVFFISCNTSKKAEKDVSKLINKEDIHSKSNKFIVTAPIVEKRFVKKDGQLTEIKELYLRQSIQDYFIKFSESAISREELESYINNIEGLIKTITVEVEFRKGKYLCEDDSSDIRTGDYVIIHKIIRSDSGH